MFEETDPRHELWDEEEEEEEEEEEGAEEEENGVEFQPWVQDPQPTFGVPLCPTGQVTRWCPSRTLSHPSFQALYSARGQDGPLMLSGSGPKPGPLPVIDRGGFFYSDPTMPPGHRIYNWLSRPSQEVFLNLKLNTPPPIMSTCVSAPLRPPNLGLSELEQKAVSALLELPAGLTCALDTGQSLPGLEEAEDARK